VSPVEDMQKTYWEMTANSIEALDELRQLMAMDSFGREDVEYFVQAADYAELTQGYNCETEAAATLLRKLAVRLLTEGSGILAIDGILRDEGATAIFGMEAEGSFSWD